MNKIVQSLELIGFKSMSDRSDEETQKRYDLRKNVIKFRNPYLRATLGGIVFNDTILIGAESGLGKTQLASEIAEDAARSGKKVFVFALEADTGEWERRRKYGVLSDLYKEDGGDTSRLDYQDWMLGSLKELDQYEQRANEVMANNHAYSNIYTFYKDDIFGINDFVKKFSIIDAHADLVIVDHIHYFDLFSSNHNEELSAIVKQIRTMTQVLNIPIILIAHLRKLQNPHERKLVPDISDFHGSSELSKVATRAILLGGGPYIKERNEYVTYVKAVKNRWGGSRTKFIGMVFYDPARDRYNTTDVVFGRDVGNRFEALNKEDQPPWLERASTPE